MGTVHIGGNHGCRAENGKKILILNNFSTDLGSRLRLFSTNFGDRSRFLGRTWSPGAQPEAYGFQKALIVCLEGVLRTF